jgi:guanylate kinase
MIVILSGPSGVGKDTVIEAWRVVNPLVERVVTVTTRRPRSGETHGRDYVFVSDQEFRDMAARGAFLEHKLVHGSWYATPADEVDRLVAEGKIVVLKIDVQGAAEVKKTLPRTVSVFLLPPSLDELRRRLDRRGTDRQDEVDMRLANAEMEIRSAHEYDHQVVNDNLEETVRRLESIVAQTGA